MHPVLRAAAVGEEDGKGSACWAAQCCVLPSAGGVGKLLGGQKPSWFLQSLEFRKNWELEDLVTLKNQTLISLS